MRMSLGLGMLSLFVVMTTAGCVREKRGVPVDAGGRELKQAALGASESSIIADRYLLVPVMLLDSKQAVFQMGSFSSSSWSGFGGWTINLIVIDLDAGTQRRVFDEPVAMALHPASFAAGNLPPVSPSRPHGATDALAEQGILLITARTEDRDGDGKITSKDPQWLFRYELEPGRLTRISPDGHDLDRVTRRGGELVMLLRPEGGNTLSVYRYRDGAGNFVAEGLRP